MLFPALSYHRLHVQIAGMRLPPLAAGSDPAALASHNANHFDSVIPIPKLSGDTFSHKTTGGGNSNGRGAVGTSVSGNDRSNVSPSGKPIADASAVIASQLAGHSSALDQDGTSLTAAVVVTDSETKGKEGSNKSTTECAHPSVENGISHSNAIVGGMKYSGAKIYADDN